MGQGDAGPNELASLLCLFATLLQLLCSFSSNGIIKNNTKQEVTSSPSSLCSPPTPPLTCHPAAHHRCCTLALPSPPSSLLSTGPCLSACLRLPLRPSVLVPHDLRPTHGQWSTAERIRQETFTASHHLWLCWSAVGSALYTEATAAFAQQCWKCA